MNNMSNTSNLPDKFIYIMAISAVVVGGSVFFSLPILLLGLLVCGAVIGYCMYVNQFPTQNQNSADSIYYFGFSLSMCLDIIFLLAVINIKITIWKLSTSSYF